MLGDGPLRDAVENEVRVLGLRDIVHVAGFRADADSILAAADVACLSSREEGMGSVLLDALAFGIPIAATAAGGIPEIVVDDESGLLASPRDPTALGAAIARLLTDGALAARIAANGRARAAEFSVERMVDRTIAVYDRVLGSAGPRTNAASSASSDSVIGAP
jgi:glycosyltransferase involved in cell wall biosynthesis